MLNWFSGCRYSHDRSLFSFTCAVSELCCKAVLVTRPQNTVSFIGDTAVLQCRTNDSQLSMTWSTILRDIATSTGILPKYVSRMWLNTSAESQFDLLINSTRQSDAGTYRCSEVFGEGARADLTVIGKWLVTAWFYIHDLHISVIFLSMSSNWGTEWLIFCSH